MGKELQLKVKTFKESNDLNNLDVSTLFRKLAQREN